MFVYKKCLQWIVINVEKNELNNFKILNNFVPNKLYYNIK